MATTMRANAPLFVPHAPAAAGEPAETYAAPLVAYVEPTVTYDAPQQDTRDSAPRRRLRSKTPPPSVTASTTPATGEAAETYPVRDAQVLCDQLQAWVRGLPQVTYVEPAVTYDAPQQASTASASPPTARPSHTAERDEEEDIIARTFQDFDVDNVGSLGFPAARLAMQSLLEDDFADDIALQALTECGSAGTATIQLSELYNAFERFDHLSTARMIACTFQHFDVDNVGSLGFDNARSALRSYFGDDLADDIAIQALLEASKVGTAPIQLAVFHDAVERVGHLTRTHTTV